MTRIRPVRSTSGGLGQVRACSGVGRPSFRRSPPCRAGLASTGRDGPNLPKLGHNWPVSGEFVGASTNQPTNLEYVLRAANITSGSTHGDRSTLNTCDTWPPASPTQAREQLYDASGDGWRWERLAFSILERNLMAESTPKHGAQRCSPLWARETNAGEGMAPERSGRCRTGQQLPARLPEGAHGSETTAPSHRLGCCREGNLPRQRPQRRQALPVVRNYSRVESRKQRAVGARRRGCVRSPALIQKRR